MLHSLWLKVGHYSLKEKRHCSDWADLNDCPHPGLDGNQEDQNHTMEYYETVKKKIYIYIHMSRQCSGVFFIFVKEK